MCKNAWFLFAFALSALRFDAMLVSITLREIIMNVTHISLTRYEQQAHLLERNARVLSKVKSLVTSASSQFQSGDEFRTNDGLVIAIYVEALTDFTHSFSKEHAEFAVSGKPTLISYDQKTAPCDLDVKCYRGYMTRHVVCPDGTFMYQLLTKAFGEPVWINLPSCSKIRENVH